MEQNQALIDHLVKRVSLNEDEIQEFISYFKITKVKKRQFIIQPDFIPKYRNYVLKGAFRAYIVVDQGEEHTIQFAVEDWWDLYKR